MFGRRRLLAKSRCSWLRCVLSAAGDPTPAALRRGGGSPDEDVRGAVK
jgi:hypothetical protein